MKGIIRSQLYETKVTLSMWIVALIAFVMTFMDWKCAVEEYTGTGLYTGVEALSETCNHTMAIYFLCFTIAHFVCRNWKNKTLYQDVLAGYSRKQVFFGRVIPAFVIGVTGALVLTYGDVVFHTIVHGWGSDVSVGAVFMDLINYVLLLFRLMAEVVLLSVVLKRTSVVFILCLIVDYMEFSIIIMGGKPLQFPWVCGMFFSKSVTIPETSEVFNEAGEIVQAYSFGTMGEYMILMGSSLIIGGICLFAAYRIFKKKQMY